MDILWSWNDVDLNANFSNANKTDDIFEIYEKIWSRKTTPNFSEKPTQKSIEPNCKTATLERLSTLSKPWPVRTLDRNLTKQKQNRKRAEKFDNLKMFEFSLQATGKSTGLWKWNLKIEWTWNEWEEIWFFDRSRRQKKDDACGRRQNSTKKPFGVWTIFGPEMVLMIWTRIFQTRNDIMKTLIPCVVCHTSDCYWAQIKLATSDSRHRRKKRWQNKLNDETRTTNVFHE